MDMSSLFPSDAAAAAGLPDQSGPHISFRAGMLNRDAATNQVTPDPRPGTLQLLTHPDDDLMHLQWRPRPASSSATPAPAPPADGETPEHDYIVLAGQTEFKQVTSCPSTARVYVLKWREEDTRLFFWMQEKDASKDAINVATVNAILEHGALAQQNTPGLSFSAEPAPESREVRPPTPGPPAAEPPATDTPMAAAPRAEGPLSDAALEQLRTLLAPSAGAGAAPGAGTGSAGGGAAATAAALQLQQAQRHAQLTTPTPLDLLQPDVVQPALADPAVAAALPALLAEHAPPADRHPSRLPDLLRSPALRAQAAAAASALTSGPADGLLRQFGLDGGAADAEPFGARRLLNALRALQRRSASGGAQPEQGGQANKE